MKFINGVKNQGFTLIELLIVVVILGVLAAVAIPQFTASTDDAKVAALDSSLATMRTAIDMYYQDHGEYPAANGDGTNLANTSGAFTSQLTRFSDDAGTVSDTKVGNFKYGPYLKKGIPADPITGSSTIDIVSAGDLSMTGADTAGGWRFDSVSGQIIMDSTDNGYDTH